MLRRRLPLVLTSLIAVAAFSLLAPGCGGGGGSRAGTTQTGALAFTRCMRSHGVPNFPDPPAIGARAPKPDPQQLGVSSSRFQAASSSCDHLPAVAQPATATGDCDSVTTCYTPRQLQAAYGILPLLEHGTDGRGETVVLPELAEPQFPLPGSDLRRDL